MLAVLPGGPRISYVTTFGLNCTILIPLPPLAFRSCEPKTLCRRVTTSPETARTTTKTTGIQQRLSKPPTEIALTRSPPANRFAVTRERIEPQIHSVRRRWRLYNCAESRLCPVVCTDAW